MGGYGKATGLVAHLGAAMGITLTLDDAGEAAFRCADGTVVVIASSPDGAVLVLEAMPQDPVWPGDPAVLRAALALNRDPDLGFASLAAHPMERSLVLRQQVDTEPVDQAGFVNIVSRFVAAAGLAFARLPGAAAGTIPDTAPVRTVPDDFMTIRL